MQNAGAPNTTQSTGKFGGNYRMLCATESQKKLQQLMELTLY